MRVLHYVDAENISWLVPYIESLKALEALGIEQALMCRPGGEMESCARENGIETLTFRPLVSAVPVLSPGFVRKVKGFVRTSFTLDSLLLRISPDIGRNS